MSDVKRWALMDSRDGDGDPWIGEIPTGKYVLYSDYAALEARCRELEGKKNGATTALMDRMVQAEKDRDELRAALRAQIHKTGLELDMACCPSASAILLRLGDLEQTDAGLRWRT